MVKRSSLAQLHEAESVPLTLDQVNACVGNVLPLPPNPLLLGTRRLTTGYIAQPTALGSGILFSYPEISTIAGLQGLIIYTLSSALPLLIFAFLGPIIRKKCPEGFVLTEWTRQRYGVVTALYLSLLTLVILCPHLRGRT